MTLCVLKKQARKGRKAWWRGTVSLTKACYADCLSKTTLGFWELALDLTEGRGRGRSSKKLISISFEAMLKCLQGLHAGLHMSHFNYMCWKKKMAMCKVVG